MLFHALGSFTVVEQSERRLPPLRSVLSLGIMDFALMLAHGGAIPPLIGIGCLACGCLVGGVILAAKSRTMSRWILGACLSLVGVAVIILALAFFRQAGQTVCMIFRR